MMERNAATVRLLEAEVEALDISIAPLNEAISTIQKSMSAKHGLGVDYVLYDFGY